ncbi:MAG: hypothetical protein R3D83_10495 [Caenibius sp.]
MPQIAQLAETYSSQVFWLLVFFGFVFLVIGQGMVPRVMDTVACSDKQIADDLAAAGAARQQADAWKKKPGGCGRQSCPCTGDHCPGQPMPPPRMKRSWPLRKSG